MLKHHEKAPITPRTLVGMFLASVGLGCGLLAGAEAVGATNAGHALVQQEAWNAKNAEAAALRQDRLAAMTPAAYTSGGARVLPQELTIDLHPTISVEPLRHEYQKKSNRSREYSLYGGLALFVMGGSRLRRRTAPQMAISELAVEAPGTAVHTGRTATAQRKISIQYTPAGDTAKTKTERPGHSAVLARVGVTALSLQDTPATELTYTLPERVEPVPPHDEIDPAYVGAFEPQLYAGETYGSPMAALDQALAGPAELSTLGRRSHRWRTAIARQLAVSQAAPYNAFAVPNQEPLPPLDGAIMAS